MKRSNYRILQIKLKNETSTFLNNDFLVHVSFTTVLLFECKHLTHKIIQKVKFVNCLELCPWEAILKQINS
jgi:hypothetical protein